MKFRFVIRMLCSAALLILASCAGTSNGIVPHYADAKPAVAPPGQGGDYSPPIKTLWTDHHGPCYWANLNGEYCTAITSRKTGKTFTCRVMHGGQVIWYPGNQTFHQIPAYKVETAVSPDVIVQANEEIRKQSSLRGPAPLTEQERRQMERMSAAFSSWQVAGMKSGG